MLIKSNQFPTPRSEFAYTRIGEILVIYGGEIDSVLLGDMHYLNLRTQEWKSVESTSTVNPANRKGSCMASANDSIFIFGGITNQGYSNELWKFDSGSGTYALLDSFGDIPIKSARGGCKAYINQDNDVIFETYLGESVGRQALSSIYSYNVSTKVWTYIREHSNDVFSKSQTATLYIDNKLLVAGGAFWSFRANDEIYIYDSDKRIHQKVGNLPRKTYNAASVFYKNKLYIYGGGASFNRLPLSKIPVNDLIVIEFDDYCSDRPTFCKESCSPGTHYRNDSCITCSEGFYSKNIGSSVCTPCPKGYFSDKESADSEIFCKPCSEYTFNEKEGQRMCYDCAENSKCSETNVSLTIDEFKYETTYFDNPDIYKSNQEKVSEYTDNFNLILALISTVILLLLISIKRIRIFITNLDYYSLNHNYSGVMIVKQTFIGGLTTIILIIISISLAFSMGLAYSIDNIEETKALVPSVIIREEYGSVRYI